MWYIHVSKRDFPICEQKILCNLFYKKDKSGHCKDLSLKCISNSKYIFLIKMKLINKY